MNNPLLAVKQLTCYRGERLLLGDISFQLQAGEILQITGANGSGKTTLLRILTGLYPLQTGEVNWRGQSILACREEYHQHMSYLGHSLGVKSELTVLENLTLHWRVHAEITDPMEALLTRFSLNHCQNELCRHLSRGQRQCLALARLMGSNTLLWILDEPFASLDLIASDSLQQIFMEKLDAGGAIVFTSHQPLTAMDVEPKIIALARQL